MYIIESVKVDGFWHRFVVNGEFKPEVNIVIGKNGTGKTTFMNILHAVLSVDVEALISLDFDSVEIHLTNGSSKRKILAEIIDDGSIYSQISYKISSKKHIVPLINPESRQHSFVARKRAQVQIELLKVEMERLIKIASLSVYRLRSSDSVEVRDRHNTLNLMSPVDYRLKEVLSNLTKFQLELAQQASEVSTKLQKDVLGGLLYSKSNSSDSYNLDVFNKNQERELLTNAFKRLASLDKEMKERINHHVEAVALAFESLREARKEASADAEVLKIAKNFDFEALDAFVKTRKVISLSSEAENKISIINSPIELLQNTIHEFIEDKKFNFLAGSELTVHNKYCQINVESLSSGEKQLLILFIETLLQRNQRYIFLTDEPEISLHISWQRKIIPAIRKLNPKAQVIVATHSPEVAARYRDSIIDMEKMIHG
ncbi:AAA family ATPase [Shewanella xiamenensis]|uniref:ATP-binding protein n=1 Tax=Shewanella xiamenensis TaxID=332186 RepID=A0ABT6UCU9_9GAMM|nr:AAA family ATPase [Shewanella xiamenensis]MDI5832294.1 ATP-binding protein [Shewanella xiamenensis]